MSSTLPGWTPSVEHGAWYPWPQYSISGGKTTRDPLEYATARASSGSGNVAV
jgi:hypothetical protein